MPLFCLSCEYPTTDRALNGFTMVQMNWIESRGMMVKRFLPKVTQRQEELLRLAVVPVKGYQKDWSAVLGG